MQTRPPLPLLRLDGISAPTRSQSEGAQATKLPAPLERGTHSGDLQEEEGGELGEEHLHVTGL